MQRAQARGTARGGLQYRGTFNAITWQRDICHRSARVIYVARYTEPNSA